MSKRKHKLVQPHLEKGEVVSSLWHRGGRYPRYWDVFTWQEITKDDSVFIDRGIANINEEGLMSKHVGAYFPDTDTFKREKL